MKLLFAILFLSLLNTACIKQEIHQGNVFKEDSIWLIQEGDTRFVVEAEWGIPAIHDTAHPKRALYIEYVDDEVTEERYTRGAEITYDNAWRVSNIRRFGWE